MNSVSIPTIFPEHQAMSKPWASFGCPPLNKENLETSDDSFSSR